MINIKLIYLSLLISCVYTDKNIVVFNNEIKNVKINDIYGIVIRNYSLNIFDFKLLSEIVNDTYYLEISNNNVNELQNSNLLSENVKVLNLEKSNINYFNLSCFNNIFSIILSYNKINYLYTIDSLKIEYIYMDNIIIYNFTSIIENINKLQYLKKISLRFNHLFKFDKNINCNKCIVDLSDNYIHTIEYFVNTENIIYLYNNCIYEYTRIDKDIYISKCDKNDTFDKCINVYGNKNYTSGIYCINEENKISYTCVNYLVNLETYNNSEYIDFCELNINKIEILWNTLKPIVYYTLKIIGYVILYIIIITIISVEIWIIIKNRNYVILRNQA
ncbi:ORF MSV047 hypothetical protein [Melanoplus sanguinipes entomopoxvirus]|uniref:Uncharacterized protein n=1 Tax=Melanoplus sanguinipes entomopoxvirus TaxID=83191 RepID=Q9YW45_MSEPV|nr:ORF MSV047 hypothetical protein [Melanoplus sanguinipes entomopoxvirus]AAC97829.1 ORF MSV047 hypothetical protein [Melanoplus sanguinipes entomopoxvirus 'O']